MPVEQAHIHPDKPSYPLRPEDPEQEEPSSVRIGNIGGVPMGESTHHHDEDADEDENNIVETTIV